MLQIKLFLDGKPSPVSHLEIALLPQLSTVFSVSTDELLYGERIVVGSQRSEEQVKQNFIMHQSLIQLVMWFGYIFGLMMFFIRSNYLWHAIPVLISVLIGIGYSIIINNVFMNKTVYDQKSKILRQNAFIYLMMTLLIILLTSIPLYVYKTPYFDELLGVTILFPVNIDIYLPQFLMTTGVALMVTQGIRDFMKHRKMIDKAYVIHLIPYVFVIFTYIIWIYGYSNPHRYYEHDLAFIPDDQYILLNYPLSYVIFQYLLYGCLAVLILFVIINHKKYWILLLEEIFIVSIVLLGVGFREFHQVLISLLPLIIALVFLYRKEKSLFFRLLVFSIIGLLFIHTLDYRLDSEGTLTAPIYVSFAMIIVSNVLAYIGYSIRNKQKIIH